MIEDIDQVSFELACHVSSELRSAMGTIDNAKITEYGDRYLVYTCDYVRNALDGYCELRQASKNSAARLLLRPVIEKVLYLQAVENVPASLHSILFTDYWKETSLVNAALRSGAQDNAPGGLLTLLRKRWDQFDREYKAKYPQRSEEWHKFSEEYKARFPADEMKPSNLKIVEVARIANLEEYYDSYFRVYCQHSHGSLRAMLGQWDDLKHEDNVTASFAGLTAINVLIRMGVPVPEPAGLWKRHVEIGDELLARQKKQP